MEFACWLVGTTLFLGGEALLFEKVSVQSKNELYIALPEETVYYFGASAQHPGKGYIKIVHPVEKVIYFNTTGSDMKRRLRNCSNRTPRED